MTDVKSIFRTEWLKLKGYRAFWFLVAAYPLSLGAIVFLSVWGQSKAVDMASKTGSGLDSNLPLGFPQVWHNLAYISSWLYFIPCLLVILNVTNEFSFRTHRQNLLEGWSRGKFVAAKILVALTVALACSVTTLLFSFLAGLASRTAPDPEGLKYQALFFLQTYLYLLVALLFGFVVRRAALGVASFFLYSVIVENVLSLLLNIYTKGLGAYLPLNVASTLLPLPYYKENAPAAAKAFFAEPSTSLLLIVACAYIFSIAALLWYRFSREDL